MFCHFGSFHTRSEHELSESNEVAQSCPTLVTLWTVACQAPLSMPQARILEWVAISFSRGSSQPRDQTRVSHIADRLFTL